MFDQAQKLRDYYNSPVSKKANNNRQLISITSGKGGTGKTFAAFYLSQFLAKQGYKTLLVEFDFNLGSLSYHLNINPDATICDLFSGSALFDETIVEVENNYSIIFGDNGKLNFPENKVAHIRNFFGYLNNKTNNYDYIILDNGAGISNEIFETIKHSTMNLIVTTPDPVAVMDAYVILKLMTKNSIDIHKGIIINKCKNPEEGKTAFENLSKASKHFLKEDINFVGSISNFDLTNSLQLISSSNFNDTPNRKLFSEFELISHAISKIGQVANNHQPNFIQP